MTTNKMKAIVCTKYGSPNYLQLQEVNIPTPKKNEVLIRVHATTVTKADTMMRRAEPFISRFFLGFTKPKNDITGTGFAGEIVSIGTEISKYKIGNKVFGESGITFGANAEYVCVSEDGVISHLPKNLSFEQAATLCDGPLTSINFLKELAAIQPGQKVLINGASGSLGTAAVQLAKYFGAYVTGVCSGKNAQLVWSLGADKVIDYTTTDLTKDSEKYDIIYDTVGKLSYTKCKKVLTKEGIYLSPVLDMKLLLQMLWTSKFSSQKAKFAATGLEPAPKLRKLVKELTKLIEEGKLKSIIDRSYTLAETPEAHRYVDTGHKKGNVIIQLIPS
jgi:NADPH:quinone reductase-like Zn-dependent oxidoreductase